jgi:hypothetical protein
MDTDENDLMRQIQMIRESIRLDWKDLASKKLTFDQRKAIREGIQMCISALRVRPETSRLITEFSEHEAD